MLDRRVIKKNLALERRTNNYQIETMDHSCFNLDFPQKFSKRNCQTKNFEGKEIKIKIMD
jgi:hypothetical protein